MAGKISITTDPPLEALVNHFRISRLREMGLGVGAVAAQVRRNLKLITPQRTGALVRSQRMRRIGQLEWEIIEGVPYGQILRSGVSPGNRNPILPVRAKMLFWAGARHPVRIVTRHPGIKKNDYFTKAIQASRGDITKVSNGTAIMLARSYADFP